MMVPWWGLIIVIIVIGYALIVDKKHPCRNCEIFLNPDSDYRHCWDCEKVKK